MLTTTASRNSPACARAASSPSASSAAATACCAMALARRKRGCARNAGRVGGGGTFRTRNGLSQPGRAKACIGNGAPFSSAALKAGTPHPAGDTAPKPCAKIRLMPTSEKRAWRLRRRIQMSSTAPGSISRPSAGARLGSGRRGQAGPALICGGSHCPRSAMRQTTASTAPAAPSKWPMHALVELTGRVAARPPAQRLMAAASVASFCGVAVPWALT